MRTYDLTPVTEGKPLRGVYALMVDDLLHTTPFHTGEWQAMDTRQSKAHMTHELEDVTIVIDPLPRDLERVVPHIDHDWADEHFSERVSGIPHNPAPSHVDWPYAVRGNADHIEGQTFDHTYPERFWPKHASHDHSDMGEWWSDGGRKLEDYACGGRQGVRFLYGDLNDLVDLLVRSPLTRQAYLPVWFPEDTGAVDKQRVPCTLGYHFMIREGRLSCRYYLRSCDIYRHFSNDVYLAAMLTRWVMQQVNRRSAEIGSSTPLAPLDLRLGRLVMHISSLHAFVGDISKIKSRLDQP